MMKQTLSLLSLVLFAAACSSSSVATAPVVDGGKTDDAGKSDGGGASDDCPTGGPTATFQLDVVGDTPYCDASGCDASFLSITREDGTPVDIRGGCVASCDDCRPIACPAACRPPGTIGATGVTSTWNGTTFETSTCGQGTQCAKTHCAAPGTYVAHMCGYPSKPQDGGVSGVCQAVTQTPTCTDVPFTWPPTGTVKGTLGTK